MLGGGSCSQDAQSRPTDSTSFQLMGYLYRPALSSGMLSKYSTAHDVRRQSINDVFVAMHTPDTALC